ncbi:prepilin-type N-terminal cleavage/methylation domain-containing protein [Leeuwenhoekiella sp. H156]|uniref:prepilin-type N-terminal cleavage/methylation domain-containing protein n=1 Tax=Leeuwenhoekiella sp. H156 TaxID=3450128 RepID=UPI003FA45FE0
MLSRQRLKAFTLSEMLVVLVITTIVVGLAFVILNLVTKQVNLIESNYSENQKFDKLETALWIDFNSFEYVYYNEVDSELSFSGMNRKATYVFTSEYCIRNRDTIPGGFQVQAFFLGRELENGLIDAIKLDQNDRELFVFKNSDASLYMSE